MEWRNPTKLQNGDFDCEVDLPGYGWVPYTASTSDPISAALHSKIAASGPVADAPAPVIEASCPTLSARQFVWLLAYTGYDETWGAVTEWLRDKDRSLYADLQSERARTSFEFDRVEYILQRPDVEAVLSAIGKEVDIDAVISAWPLAAAK